MELLIARNPDPESRLAYLLRLPLGDGMVFRTSGTWPRTTALYCYPVPSSEWPQTPDIVEHVPVRSCIRRGAAIDLVLDRSRENRSQIVFTTARGRDAVFWQSPRALGELACLPRAAVVVEDRYSAIFTLDRVRPAVVADGLAELQVRWPTIPLVFCETRPFAEEWTYRYLGAAHTWAASEPAALARITGAPGELDNAPTAPEPSTAEVRAWARAHAITVPDRGKLRPEVWDAWRAAHGDGAHTGAAVL